jgi:predicted ATPase
VWEGGASYGAGSNAKPYLPDLIFGYYSGSNRKLEKLFDAHQSRYYGVINKERGDEEYDAAQAARRLFYCRPIHGVLALLSYLAKPGADGEVTKLLTEKLGITGFHSALAHFKEPSWFSHGNWQKSRHKADGAGRGRRTYDTLSEQAVDIWGARGPAGACARALRDTAFHPLTTAGKIVDDYRHKPRTEAQLACFLRDKAALKSFSDKFDTDQDMFAALEAADISDLFREMIVWVSRKNDDSGDISFSDLSDGERQLLMVLGLIRVSRGKEALFLLDEPDTHLNPAWQLTYLELIREWTEVAADEDKCQIIMTSHNPLTIAALEAKEVRVMSADDDGNITVAPPRIDPKGLGFAGVLTDIFGLSSSLDKPTQEKIDRRNELACEDELSPAMAKEFTDIKNELRHLGFLYEERDKLYSEFLRQLDNVELADVDPLTPDELRAREAESREIVERLLKKQ